MSDMPERIWATEDADYCTKWPTPHSKVEYIRADLSPSPEVVKELVGALELADAALSGADIDMKHVWRKIKPALANANLEGGE